MRIEVLKSKIHRVKITQAEFQYVGSNTIDKNLMGAANIIEGEKGQVVNLNNGERLETYAIRGELNTGTVLLNSPVTRNAQVGYVVIILSCATMEFEDVKKFKPWIIFPTPDNRIF